MSLPEQPFIFVSYSSKDSDVVYPEIMRLVGRGYGYKVWYDKGGQLQPGLAWDNSIREALLACSCFIVFMTQDAINSENVRKEIDLALEVGKPFICVYLEKITLPLKYQEHIPTIQALERYAMHEDEYELPLKRALTAYIGPGWDNSPPLPAPRLDMLPTIIFYALLALVAACLLLALTAVVTPHIPSKTVDGPLGDPVMGVLAGVGFTIFAFILGGMALAVYGIYLRRRNG